MDPLTLHGDCLDVLRTFADGRVDAIVTDPPYGLADHKPAAVATALTAWAGGDREVVPAGRGFMGRDWDAFVPPPAVWDECLRVLRPGGHLVVFSGARTVDLMGLSIRLAGFEVRDTISAWLYGSGMPKGLDVGKAIDKARDDRPDILHVTAFVRAARNRAGLRNADVDAALGVTAMCDHWCRSSPLQAAIPTPEQWEQLRVLLGFGDEMDDEVARLNGRKGTWGNERVDRVITAGWDRSVYSTTGNVEHAGTPVLDAARQWAGWNTALKGAHEPILVARKPLDGTVAGNVLAHGVGAYNVDGCRVGTSDADRAAARVPQPAHAVKAEGAGTYNFRTGEGRTGERFEPAPAGRWPTNVVLTHHPDCGPGDDAPCAEGCHVAALDEQSGVTTSTSGGRTTNALGQMNDDAWVAKDLPRTGHDDVGGASRFFPTFRYQAKAPKAERPQVDGRGHPTVKPLALMQWLVRLVTPPGGVVLDPFAGSGTTLHAARDEGFVAVGIERDAHSVKLIEQRLGAVPDPEPGAA